MATGTGAANRICCSVKCLMFPNGASGGNTARRQALTVEKRVALTKGKQSAAADSPRCALCASVNQFAAARGLMASATVPNMASSAHWPD